MNLTNFKLCCVIYHIVERLTRVEGRTRLLKLVYLADLEATRKLGRSISEARFYSYTYGPFAREVLEALREMDGFWIEQHTMMEADGERSYFYTLSDFPAEPLSLADPEALDILDSVITRWGRRDLRSILDHVYSTEPFKSTPAGADIDLSRIAARHAVAA